MRSYPLTLTNVVQFPARLVKITCLDGTILRIAEADETITVGNAFTPLPGCTISAIKHIINGEMPSMEIRFAHSVGGVIDTEDLNNGVWDGAEVIVYVVDRASLSSLGDPIFTGTIQPITIDPIGGGGSFDIRGIAAQAESVIQTYQPMCRTDLFSSLCQLNEDDFKYTCTIATIIDAYNFIVSGVVSPPADGYFNQGVCLTDGGLAFVTSNWTQSSSKITMMPDCRTSRLTEGEGITLYAGCDKTAATCLAKFNNIINFQGEPHFLGINSIVGV